MSSKRHFCGNSVQSICLQNFLWYSDCAQGGATWSGIRPFRNLRKYRKRENLSDASTTATCLRLLLIWVFFHKLVSVSKLFSLKLVLTCMCTADIFSSIICWKLKEFHQQIDCICCNLLALYLETHNSLAVIYTLLSYDTKLAGCPALMISVSFRSFKHVFPLIYIQHWCQSTENLVKELPCGQINPLV